jgi:hypothetical protein
VGHHLQGHTLQAGGSRPPTELEADRYSGYVLFRMGATLDQSQAAMRALGSDTGSATHPDRSSRLAAITNGWVAACELAGDLQRCNVGGQGQARTPNPNLGPNRNPGPNPNPNPNPNPGPAVPGNTIFIIRLAFAGDPTPYFVTQNNDIVAAPAGAPPVIVGRRQPSSTPEFAWMYQTLYITYGVTPNGVVMSRSQFGVPFQVGQVVPLQFSL